MINRKTTAGLMGLAMLVLTAGNALAQGQSGTTLIAEKTAAGYWERSYDWTVLKTATPLELTFGPSPQTITYQITATRLAPTDVYGVQGQVCVTNGGAVTTENLKIVDRVQYKTGAGAFQDLPGASQTILPAQLAPGQSNCYGYQIPFTPVAGAIYRNAVKVTITNHSGHLGKEWGPEPKADFSLPGSPTLIIDANASVADVQTCPSGFTCTPSDPGPWSFTGTGTISFTNSVSNVSACVTAYLVNTATLTELSTLVVRTDGKQVTLQAEPCQTPACTLTLGYWKNHPTAWPVGALSLGSVEYNKAQLLSILNQPVGGNGLISLAHQLIAAKLNVAADAGCVAAYQAINSADVLIGALVVPPAGVGYLHPSATDALVTLLDAYNNGVAAGCPGHCQ